MYKTYSYSNMPKPLTERAAPKPPQKRADNRDTKVKTRNEEDRDTKNKEIAKKCGDTKNCCNDGLLADLSEDDIILIVVAFLLLADGCDDKLLLIAIAYIFLSGKN